METAHNKPPEATVTDLGPATALNYQLSLKGAERAYRQADADDKKVISGMKSDCEYVIEWLNTGRRPGNKRGIERRAGYEREVLLDPIRMQAFASDSKAGSPSNLTDWERFQIKDALSRLSDRQRECYILKHGECFSYADIARMLKMEKGTVQYHVEEAQRKISEDLASSLFLM